MSDDRQGKLCDVCGHEPATISYAEMVDGRLTTWNLCERCAREKGVSVSFAPFTGPLVNILMGLLEDADESGGEPLDRERCPQCGATYDEFRRTGKLGCGVCYEVFHHELRPLIRRIHGSTRHAGVVPKTHSQGATLANEIRGLRFELDRLVAAEDYEAAARVRDEIRAREKKLARGADHGDTGGHGSGERPRDPVAGGENADAEGS